MPELPKQEDLLTRTQVAHLLINEHQKLFANSVIAAVGLFVVAAVSINYTEGSVIIAALICIYFAYWILQSQNQIKNLKLEYKG
jgi:uncharacterized membrane-anchored protein